MTKSLARSLAIAAVFTGGYLTADVLQEPHAVHASSHQIDGYTYSADVVEAFNEINRIRKATGLQPYKIDPFLSKSAESHAKYLVTHVKGGSHDQTPGKSGYTGTDYKARAKAAGYTINIGTESVVYGGGTTKKKISDIVEGIHHRDSILNSSFDRVGVGLNGNALVIVSDNSDSSQGEAVSYPYNGQKDAPTLFDVNEKPDPLAKYGVKTSGYMVSYKPSEALNWFGGHTMTLRDSNGSAVVLHNKNNEPDLSGNTLYIVPKAELKKGETYTVNVTYMDIDDNKHSHSWSFTTEGSGSVVAPPPTNPSKPTPPPTTDYSKYSKQFADFNPNAWWAKDMVWAVERGYISGYGNVKNPKTGKYENYLRPGNTLTEGHFLMIMFRYIAPDEYRAVKPASKWSYSAPYTLAKKYNLPTLGNESSASKKAYATQGIRRGKLAQLLVSMHEGKPVSESTAINFMMKNKITMAKSVKEFNANQILTRAQVSAFLQRHEAYVESLNTGH